MAVRLALRDLARYRARSGPALSAVTATVLIAVLICVLAAVRFSNGVDYFGPNLQSNQVAVYTPSGASATGITSLSSVFPMGDQSTAALRRYEVGVRAIASSLSASNVLTLDTATGLLLQTSDGGTDVGLPYVGTPELLAHYGIHASPSAPLHPD